MHIIYATYKFISNDFHLFKKKEESLTVSACVRVGCYLVEVKMYGTIITDGQTSDIDRQTHLQNTIRSEC